MSMLAGPRRKQKLSADPRGNAWSKDESKFGHKLLEKFGWSKGKGLGANEDGKVDHVKISMKNDTRGVGCSRNHEDNWIAHQDDFNDLLSSLNQDTPEKDTNDEKESDKVTGLEKKSKASRSRVHYQKFTKGKDLSSRSREDMACIFGRRKIKQEADLTPSSEDDDSSSDSQSKTQHGVITVRSTDSVQDYFAKKMAERKAAMVSQDLDDKSEDEMRPGFGIDTINSDDVGKTKKKVRFSLGEVEEDNVDTSKTKKKKLKKNRKSKDNEESIGETTGDTAEDDQDENEEDCNNRDGNKSPRKRKHSSESQVDEEVQAVKSKKLKKSKKRKTESLIDNENTVKTIEANLSSDQIESETKLAKRKQKKLLSQTQVESGEESQVKSKKMKKSKKVKADVCEDDSENNPQIDMSNNQSVKSKKKKKKRKHKPIVD
ncbi:PIN2/TERF1-interacting telomerase inhibitor 1-like isoform X2 [Mizuhopecten yessoensis]|uniref:PIN2/TERF1-interacting telomerase inhibitor 1-like isoform X2 n=1 Tax=Mizuhopecten yessoensis TaxID=6573 RepID=UPI000B45EDCA|nr:PIN2/TERF1-interacting telomerase inhibitor 1-like isoform X2 [Mizuhopecten yessoensis]